MNNGIDKNIKFLCDDLFEGRIDSVLIYGEPQDASAVLKGVYDVAKNSPQFLCSWHDAKKITTPFDFFEPILKLKYEAQYDALKEKKWFKDMAAKDSPNRFEFASLCAQEPNLKDLKDEKKRRMPLIFIDGIEELFFNMDFGHLDEKEIEKIFSIDFLEQPVAAGFGNNLRAHLHQSGLGIFYGSVLDPAGRKYNATLNNYHYLFYAHNFRQHTLHRLQKY